MGKKSIDQLIINSPFDEPLEYWAYDQTSQTFSRKKGRRSAGYIIASQATRTHSDPGQFIEIPLVNKIRPRVKEWRDSGYENATGITRRLLEHWRDPEFFDQRKFFFCQLEAIETLIFLIEAPDRLKVGIEIPSDGGQFQRLCAKMATGTGKTIVMTMLIAWQILNKVNYPKDSRFSKNILVMAPGLTVKSRLSVLKPTDPQNYFAAFNIVPNALISNLNQGRVIIHNWHLLDWETEVQLEKRKSVDRRGPKSDRAYVRDVLQEMAEAKDIVVINDEAHHAWRVPAESKIKGVRKEDIEEATKWVAGLDRIHRASGILKCFDFSATPFAPSGKTALEEALFGWIVSDFGLNDAIESGLVKTPRIVVRDSGKIDAKTYRSLLYHLYEHDDVKVDLNRPAEENDPLPSLVVNAYMLLGTDWLETKRLWETNGMPVPPVMISVVNRTETAARIKYAFDNGKIKIDELCDPAKTVHIDSNVLKNSEDSDGAESASKRGPTYKSPAEHNGQDSGLTKKELADRLRNVVNTVGKLNEPGEKFQNVISVGMLSEGWDAKTVTHIMGLRAFSSQLLCEQVVGRGLRRTSYETDPATGFFLPEYVNIFGIPFSYLPFEGEGGAKPKPPSPKIPIYPDPEKRDFQIEWPNVLRVEHVLKPKLAVDISNVKVLELHAADIIELAELAPTIDGKPDLENIKTIDLEQLAGRIRTQKIIFETAVDVFERVRPSWSGNKPELLSQLIKIVEAFIRSDWITTSPASYAKDEFKKNLVITLSMSKVVQHIFEHVRFNNTESLVPVFDPQRPIMSTEDAGTWYTGKPCERMRKNHINLCVFDSTWEKACALACDRSKHVKAWVKNDHLNFEIYYTFNGVVRKYIPDFLIKLENGTTLILEVKGQETDRDKAKWAFMQEWISAINGDGRFGRWSWAVSTDPAGADVAEIIKSLT
ncbi:MAG: BPTD_3080 family restriction endonuclease [Bdellovibrionia bacterium]